MQNEFPVSYNKELAKKLGVGWRTLVRKAREMGLEKEPGFLKKRRDEITAMAVKAHPGQKTKGLKGWCVPNSEGTRFAPGNVPSVVSIPGLMESIHEKRRDTIRREKLRIKYGLPQKTRLNLKDVY
jgi:hypothetical protein